MIETEYADDFSDYASYFVRLWSESEADEPGEAAQWRGEVESVQTGESWQFMNLETLLEILAKKNSSDSTFLGRNPSNGGDAP